jgi:transposase
MISAVRERCAGIDVHRDFVMVCVMWGPAEGEAHWEVRRFGTTVPQLQELKAWLMSQGCAEVVMESTGPYWEPVFNVLEEAVKLCLANPQEVKNRRGHKTDKKDAWWLAHLYRHDMLRASYLPPRPVRELRMLTRRRRGLIRDAAQEKNRVQKLLEQSNIKLRGVLSDVFGVSGAAMLEAIVVDGKTDPVQVAELARGTLKQKKGAIAESLQGFRLPETHRLLIRQGMEHLAALVQQLEELEREIQAKLKAEGFETAAQLLQTIPGIEQVSAAEIVAEVGPDVKAFPSPALLSSWAGVCPGNEESAGKRHSTRTTKGNPYFRATLNQSAWASSHKKQSSFQARYDKLSPRLKHKGAVIAVAHALIYAIYSVLQYQRPYKAAGAAAGPDQNKTQRLIRHHSRRLKQLQAWLPKAPRPDYTHTLKQLEHV